MIPDPGEGTVLPLGSHRARIVYREPRAAYSLVEWTAPQLSGEKSRDFALALGPFVTTPDEETPPGHDWEQLVAYAAQNTRLYPGDLIAA